MNKTLKFTLVFFTLLAYNFLIVDSFTIYFNLSNGMKTLTTSSLITLLSAILFAPLIEESIFRLAIIQNNNFKYYIYLVVSICILLFIEAYSGILLVIVFSSLFLIKTKFKNENENHFNLFLIIAAITFSIVHLPVINASSLSINVFMALIAFLPIGLFLSYIRVSYGIQGSIISHSIYNLLTLAINEIIY